MKGPEREHLLPYSALALAFRANCRLTIRGGGNRLLTWHEMPTERMGPPPGALPPMRMTASWSGSKADRPHTSLWREQRDAPHGKHPSDHFADRPRHTPSWEEKPISLFIVPPRAQASRRCQTQATQSSKSPSSASVSVPCPLPRAPGNLIAGDGAKNAFPRSEPRTGNNRKNYLTGKAPYKSDKLRSHSALAAVPVADARSVIDAISGDSEARHPRSAAAG